MSWWKQNINCSCVACWRDGPVIELIAIDEVGYVPMADIGAEFLFQVIAERAEKAAVILTTNLPFSEWTQVIPNARLCKALLDRIHGTSVEALRQAWPS